MNRIGLCRSAHLGMIMLALSCALTACDDEPIPDTDLDTETETQTDAPVDEDKDGHTADVDCDDKDADVHPGATEDCADPRDLDCDGDSEYADVDKDGYAECEDCEDGKELIHPDADEICDKVDNDCDGLIDDKDEDVIDQPEWFADTDKDGFGNPSVSEISCEQPENHVDDNTDCNDAFRQIHPDAEEVCDRVDNDCDKLVDDLDDSVVDQTEWFPDLDKDELGDPDKGVLACFAPTGFIENGRDCDDTDKGSGEASDWYEDFDEDGFGNLKSHKVACDAPTGFIEDDTDCDDKKKDINPDADEVCDGGVDNDCDGDADDDDVDVTGTTDWYPDSDGDDFGDEDAKAKALCSAPKAHIKDHTDCDDTDYLVAPGLFDWDDDIDNDCDTSIDEDVGSEKFDHDTDIQKIWNSKCSSCHVTRSSGGLSLKSSAWSNIVNAASSLRGMDYIEPGDPSKSYVWHKLNNTHIAVGGSGGAMPASGSTTASERSTIKQWILEGAVK
ncbi:MAG: hypothetical protein ACI9MC_001977 [Kiritimatiellia bacterium]|jgi:hypothetical protein